jgi:RHS repeat-associated protein
MKYVSNKGEAVSEQRRYTTGRTTSTYDTAGRLSTVTTPAGKRLSYSYDGVNHRTRLVEPGGGRFTYAWDNAGRIDHLTNPQVARTSWAYDAADRVISERLANGTRASYVYDAADRLMRLANIAAAGTTISSFAYLYDLTANRTRVIEANGDRVTWSYDSIYQLTRELRSGVNSYAVTYSYDPAGNRLTMRDGGTPTTYAYDVANELSTAKNPTGPTTYAYDANGNQTKQTSPGPLRTTWTWDYENQLTTVLLSTGIRNTFMYNGDGQKIQRQASSGTKKLIWDCRNILLETDQNNVTQVVCTLEPVTFGNLISQLIGGSAAYLLFDALGSTDRLTDGAGNITDSYVYKAFGSLAATTGTTTNPYKYIGRQGYYYDSDLSSYAVRARQYDPALGRFTSRDPHPARDQVADYQYVGNNSTNLIDPSGLLYEWLRDTFWPISIRYGVYCGPTPDATGEPDDPLDACCAAHDACYGPEGNLWDAFSFKEIILICDFCLFGCAVKASCGVYKPWTQKYWECLTFKAKIVSFFGARPLPFWLGKCRNPRKTCNAIADFGL